MGVSWLLFLLGPLVVKLNQSIWLRFLERLFVLYQKVFSEGPLGHLGFTRRFFWSTGPLGSTRTSSLLVGSTGPPGMSSLLVESTESTGLKVWKQ